MTDNEKMENIKRITESDTENISDGYHTFGELYHHRTLLFATICNLCSESAWKSKHHFNDDEPMYNDMFIVGIETEDGQATYHCDMEYWDMFHVKEIDCAPEFDGHTPEVAVNRIYHMFNNPLGRSIQTLTAELNKRIQKAFSTKCYNAQFKNRKKENT